MFLLENVPLTSHSTMRLGGNARYLTEIADRNELGATVSWAKEQNLPVLMIGSGSNIVWTDAGFAGVILINKIMGYEVQELTDSEMYVTAGAGMNWDEFVAKTVAQGLTGVEFLSLIPGTVGATPIQNVGAYGQEVANTIVTIQAYDSQTGQFVTLRASDCGFGYRSSIFKTTERGRYFIMAVTFFLRKGNPEQPYYASINQYCQQHHIQHLTPAQGRQATIEIRSSKLPDPAKVANNGSFFANPIISSEQFVDLQADFPDVSYWPIGDGKTVKLSAAWLIEQAGFKDFHDPETGMATWPKQPLVLVNESAQSTAQLLAFKQKIVNAVAAKFNVTLSQEPELLGS